MNLGERVRDYLSPRQRVETSPRVADDEVKCTTCYMCACRCGIKVHLKDGGIRYIEGNRDHPVNRGVICGKGASGIMQQYSPAKLRKPLRRVGERGSGEFREIEWEEAIATAVEWLSPIRDSDPKKPRLFHRPRPEPVADRLLGSSIRDPELRCAWRVLLGQYGGSGDVHSRQRSGVSTGWPIEPAGPSNPNDRVVEQRQRSPNSRCGPALPRRTSRRVGACQIVRS